MVTKVRLRAVLITVALASALEVSAAPTTPADKAPATPTEKIRRDFDRLISIDIDQQPLHLAIAQLHEQTHINFVLDRVTLAQMSVDPDQATVTLRLKEVKVRSVLRSLLTQFNLAFVILGDTVLISSEDVCAVRQLRQRVNVDLDKVEFSRALKVLAKETATNLVVDPRVGKEANASVTLQMEDVALETAVRLMAEMAGLKPVRVGNALFITTKAIATEMRSDPDLAPGGPMGAPAEKVIVVPPGAALPPPAATAPMKAGDPETPEKTPAKKPPSDDPPRPKGDGEKPPEKP
jgi:hypothetical protein